MECRVTVFAPHPLLGITIESRAAQGDDVHLHPAGQGVWLARMAGELGADPVLCGFVGGEPGAVLGPLLEALPGSRRLVPSGQPSGCYVIDRRSGEREAVAQALGGPPSRHELDDLFGLTCTTALESRVLAVCNPFPADSLPVGIYGDLVGDVAANGTPVIVDLSSPRLDSALAGRPALVKVNDWELAEFVSGPVDTPERMRDAAERILAHGVETVLVTRGPKPAFVLRRDDAWELCPPRFEHGWREGCGDSMMGGIAAGLASGFDWQAALTQGAAAGAANFLRRGLGSGGRATVEELIPRVELRRL